MSLKTEEAKIVETIIRQHLKDVEQEYQMGGLSNGLYADYASEVARRALATYKASIERDLKDKQ